MEKIKAEAFTSKSSEVGMGGLKLGEIASEQIMLVFFVSRGIKGEAWTSGLKLGPEGVWEALGCPGGTVGPHFAPWGSQ